MECIGEEKVLITEEHDCWMKSECNIAMAEDCDGQGWMWSLETMLQS